MTASNWIFEGEEAYGPDPRVSAAARVQPARLAGGDFCGLHRLDRDHLLVVVGDVSGHGPAALDFAHRFAALCRAGIGSDPGSLGRALERAEAELQRDNPASLFITVLALVLDLRSGDLACCNAGHEPAYATRSGSVRRLEQRGRPPLCAVEGWAVPLEHERLHPGEQLCVVTDGVTEALDPAGRLFGRAGLEAALRRSAGEDPGATIRALQLELTRFVGAAEPSDDRSIVAVRWNGSGPAPRDPRPREASFPARPEFLPEVRAFVEDAGQALGADAAAVLRIALVVEELFLNCALHGYRGEPGSMHLRLEALDDEVRLVAEDQAPPFDPFEAMLAPELGAGRVGGLGRVLIAGLATRHRYQRVDGRNRVTVHMLRLAS